MRRARRCPECKERFYSTNDAKKCQNCSGTFSGTEQDKKDAETIRRVNSSVSKDAQSVDPRTGQPTPPKKPKASKKRQSKPTDPVAENPATADGGTPE